MVFLSQAHICIVRIVVVLLVLLSCGYSPFFPRDVVGGEPLEGFSYQQEVKLPFLTSQEGALYQPVDIRVEFLHPCWAQNETHHSIRVGVTDGSGLEEIESQVYDLEFTDESHVTACSLVFLIPGTATGTETYYVLYDDQETAPPVFPDHVTVEDTQYYFEPIPGQKIDMEYYKISQDGYVAYGVIQKGMLLGNGVANYAIKMKPNSTEFETVNAEQIGAFSLSYSIDGSPETIGSAWAEEISKEVLVDGNLMARVHISAVSPQGTVQTDNIYTYYYTPTVAKRLIITGCHRVLETVDIQGDQEEDPMYAGLATFKTRSATINKMNTGEILPSIHFPSEDQITLEYPIPLDPDTGHYEWLLSTQDDMDLGPGAWISSDDPVTGHAHGLIFATHQGYLPGEEDGLQVKASVKQHVKLPGLEADTGEVIVTRNSYEPGGSHNTVLPQGINVSFDLEFFSTPQGGYQVVEQEALFFQGLSPLRPVLPQNISGETSTEKYNLTVFVHLAPAFPLGSTLSAVLGRNFTYITAELYRDTQLSSLGSVGRLPLSETTNFNFENTTLVEKIQMALGFFDWGNRSAFKRILFPTMEKGQYLVKIYRENPALRGDRSYIGFQALNLSSDTTLHIPVAPEGLLRISTRDQQGQGLPGASVALLSGTIIVTEAQSDVNGSTVLTAPLYPQDPYHLKILYQGFLVEEKPVRLGFRHTLAPRQESFTLPVYPFTLQVTDTWGFPPAVEINPHLTSAAMTQVVPLYGIKETEGTYIFTNLPAAAYTLTMGYKSVVVEEPVTIPDSSGDTLVFPAEFPVTVTTFNSYGLPGTGGGTLSLSRGGKTVEEPLDDTGKAELVVPPGDYEMVLQKDGEGVARQPVSVKGDKTVAIVTTEGSLLHTLFLIGGIALALLSLLYLLWKKRVPLTVPLILIGLLLITLVTPWWTLTGEEGDVATTTRTYLIPPKIVTLTSTSTVSGGEISSVPADFTLVLSLLSYLIIGVCILLFLSALVKTYRRLILILQICGIILLILTLVIFYYAMSQLTTVGVGSFMGTGSIDTSIPGLPGNIPVPSRWGPSSGFYLLIISTLLLLIYSCFSKKLISLWTRARTRKGTT